jgi:hypothetical protein
MTKLAQSFGWEVTENEIIVGNQMGLVGPNKAPAIVSDRKAIVNGSTGTVLNTPKLGYTPLHNAQLEEAAHMMAQASGGTVEGFETFKGGKKVLAFVKAENHTGEINGNKIEDYIVIGNSHDGSSSIFIGTSTTLLRCENQFSEIQRDFSIRHSGNIALKFEEAIEHYKKYYAQRDIMYRKFTDMSKVKIDKGLVASLTDRLFDVDRQAITAGEIEMSSRKQNQLDSFQVSLDREMTDLGSNLWGYFNAVTHYTTHRKGMNAHGDKTEAALASNSFGNVVGSNANFNKKANGIITRELGILA